MKVPGLDIDFELELSRVQFPNAVQFGGESKTSASKADDVRIYADFDAELVLLHHERKKEMVLVPFSGITLMKPLPAPAVEPTPPAAQAKPPKPEPAKTEPKAAQPAASKLAISDVDGPEELPLQPAPHAAPHVPAKPQPYSGMKK